MEICRTDVKFHYIYETVLPGKRTVLHIDRKLSIIIACVVVSAQRFPAAFFVAVFHAWFEALALAVHCSPGALSRLV